jgi:Fungal specific transcription factor domain
VRVAQRLGLHRDGSLLKLSPFKAEERRRTWWQMQAMEISIAQLLGTISMTLYSSWDVQMPANIDDNQTSITSQILPHSKSGLTGMSHVLWRYHILYLQRSNREPTQRPVWMSDNPPSQSEKDFALERYQRPLADKFLQFIEPVNPLHLHIQIGIQNFLLAVQRSLRQPGGASSRLSQMKDQERDGLLEVCQKAMEYYIMGMTLEILRMWRWHMESYFQWTACAFPFHSIQSQTDVPQALPPAPFPPRSLRMWESFSTRMKLTGRSDLHYS